MKLGYIIFLLCNFSITYGYYSSNKCTHVNNKESCIKTWPCMWCNKTEIVNYTIQNVSTCNVVYPCYHESDKYNNCVYANSYKNTTNCYIFATLLYALIILSFYISIMVILGRINLFLLRDNTSEYTRKSVNGIAFFAMFIPLIITFMINPYLFNILYIAYIIVAILSYCCFKIKDKSPEYTRINSESNYRPIK